MNAHGASGFLGSVARAFTWRKFLWVQLLALAYTLSWALGVGAAAPPHRLVGQFVNAGLNAALLMFAAFCADEAVNRGAHERRACFAAFILALASSGALQWYLRDWFGIMIPHNSLSPAEEQLFNMLVTSLDFGVVGGVAMLAYLNRRTASRALEGVRRAELQRIHRERELIESHLAAAEAQLDPQSLFAALGEVKERYEAAAPDAEAQLDRLIQHLRRALARTAGASRRAAEAP